MEEQLKKLAHLKAISSTCSNSNLTKFNIIEKSKINVVTKN